MGDYGTQAGDDRIGNYLRGVRESRRLSLDAVVEMTGSLPVSMTKSYLSRMENGQLELTFPRLYALSQVYGVPIATLAERFETDLRRRSLPQELTQQSARVLEQEARNWYASGSYIEALIRIEVLLDRLRSDSTLATELESGIGRLRIMRASSLIYLDRFHIAKDECETLLADAEVTEEDRALALFHFARCCHRMGRYPLAMMAIGRLEEQVPSLDDQVLSAGHLVSLKGNVLAASDEPRAALDAFRQAVDFFEAAGDERSVGRQRLNCATMLIECDKPREARRQLTSTLAQVRRLREARLTAFALHSLGKAAYRLTEHRTAESHFLESNAISRERDYATLIFGNCYYLWCIAKDANNSKMGAAHRRTLQVYLARVPDKLPEVQAFKAAEWGEG